MRQVSPPRRQSAPPAAETSSENARNAPAAVAFVLRPDPQLARGHLELAPLVSKATVIGTRQHQQGLAFRRGASVQRLRDPRKRGRKRAVVASDDNEQRRRHVGGCHRNRGPGRVPATQRHRRENAGQRETPLASGRGHHPGANSASPATCTCASCAATTLV